MENLKKQAKKVNKIGSEKLLYLKRRELSWLDFNDRVLQLSTDNQIPLLERANFLAISQTNLDEFFQVRVTKLVAHHRRTLLKEIHQIIKTMYQTQYDSFNNLQQALSAAGLEIVSPLAPNTKLQAQLTAYYEQQIQPQLKTLKVTPATDLKTTLQSNLLSVLCYRNGKLLNISVPTDVAEIFMLPEVPNKFFLVTDLLLLMLKKAGFTCLPYRILRSALCEMPDKTKSNFLNKLENELLNQYNKPIIYLEYLKMADNQFLQNLLIKKLALPTTLIYPRTNILNFKCFSQLKKLHAYPTHLYPSLKQTLAVPAEVDLWDYLKEQPVLLEHPFNSYQTILDLLENAIYHPDVQKIQITLYRVAPSSQIIHLLCLAAKKGRHVTVVLEFGARMDELKNINWCKILQNAGCEVIYGFNNRKIHAKLLLITTKQQQYLHLGTGNYHELTAQGYTDLSLLTTNPKLTADATAFFKWMTTGKKPDFKYFKVAPLNLRPFLVKQIKKTIKTAQKDQPASITIKVNSLADPDICELLINAAQQGVQVNLIVRGICCIPRNLCNHLPLNIISHLGRFLEHSRIYQFKNGDHTTIYLGSSDLRPANLNKRVELLFPLLNTHLKEQVQNILNNFLK